MSAPLINYHLCSTWQKLHLTFNLWSRTNATSGRNKGKLARESSLKLSLCDMQPHIWIKGVRVLHQGRPPRTPKKRKGLNRNQEKRYHILTQLSFLAVWELAYDTLGKGSVFLNNCIITSSSQNTNICWALSYPYLWCSMTRHFIEFFCLEFKVSKAIYAYIFIMVEYEILLSWSLDQYLNSNMMIFQ